MNLINHTGIALRGGLYVVTGEDFFAARSYREVVSACIEGGAGIIQLREKNWPASRIFEVGREVREITHKSGVLLIINDRVDLALALEADGVHIGQEDIPLRAVRKLAGSKLIIGVSVGTPEQALEAERSGADYIGVGPIFPTETKKDARFPRGLQILTQIRQAVSLPIYAIGGVKLHNVASVIRAGADGVAVVSAVVGAADITDAARNFVAEIDRAKTIIH
ncbi:thiamine phosphate synthase [Phosphitispora sp. TUW77]|uniref:thiamine phosphate synthase n=1 Tax=Phosphitispora sp. TUW77 TaxID=3152361 RepID=UPI003AB20F46